LGPSEIPALTFHFERKETPEENSAAAGTLTTEPVWIEVITSLPADPNAFAIADIDEVVEMKANYFWLWTALGVAFLLGIGIWIGVLIRPPKTTEIRRVYKSAHAIAFERLKAIAAENLVEQGRIKEFYEKLSTCLRHYIENRFQLRAPEQTTEEFLEQLKTSDALRLEHKQQLQKFLEHSDLVKFARYEPNPEQINESLTMAEEFVDKRGGALVHASLTVGHSVAVAGAASDRDALEAAGQCCHQISQCVKISAVSDFLASAVSAIAVHRTIDLHCSAGCCSGASAKRDEN
jgi:hypothetical protein